MGLMGFSFLLYNQTTGLLDPTSDAGRVGGADMAFSGSSFVFALISYTQTRIYPSDASLRSTRVAVSTTVGFFMTALLLQWSFNLRFESYACGFSLVQLAAIVPATCSLIKYSYQIRANMINKSTAGVSKFAMWTDFLGNVFCGVQLQIDSVIAGYPSFVQDPHFNLAKALIASFGTVNTIILLSQIHIIYRSGKHVGQDDFDVLVDNEVCSEKNYKQLLSPLLDKNQIRQRQYCDLRTADETRSDASDALSYSAKSSTVTIEYQAEFKCDYF